jgi:hypothetical protein
MSRITALIAFITAISPAFATAACEAPEHRQFDFWLGEWNVHRPDGQQVGTNSISRQYGGCVLHERYTTPRGYSGESLNAYDPGRKLWHQTWVDSAGTLLLLHGRFAGDRMQMEGETVQADGKVVKHRITWTPAPDGTVKQFWEAGSGDGQWKTVFDGTYKRK